MATCFRRPLLYWTIIVELFSVFGHRRSACLLPVTNGSIGSHAPSLMLRCVLTAWHQDMDPLLRFFDVGKRISLYLARISPQQTIDHLAYEITQLIEADDEPMSATAQPALSVSCTPHTGDLPPPPPTHQHLRWLCRWRT